jgi:predicted RNase H-like HicB family nuclease
MALYLSYVILGVVVGLWVVAAMKQPLEYYLRLHYSAVLIAEQEGGYTALIPDLPGCASVGETEDEAMAMVEDARCLWIKTAYQYGDIIPLPHTTSQGRQKLEGPVEA